MWLSAISVGTSRIAVTKKTARGANRSIRPRPSPPRPMPLPIDGKPRVASQPLADGGMTDEAKAHGDNARTQHAARGGVQAGGRQHDRKNRRERIGQCAHRDRAQRQAGDKPLRTRGIHQCAARHLAHAARSAAGRQHQPDVDLGPFLRGEIDRDERTEAGLDVGDEEDEPVEPAKAAPGGMRRLASPAGGDGTTASARLSARARSRLVAHGSARSIVATVPGQTTPPALLC